MLNGLHFLFISVFEIHGRFMKHLLQTIVPASKCRRHVLEASFTACRNCLLVNVLKEFNAPKPDIDRKRLGYLVFDKRKRLLFVDMKNIWEIFLHTPFTGGMAKYSKKSIYLQVTTMTDELKFWKEFCVAVYMSPKSNNLNNRSKIYVVLNTHHLNRKTKDFAAPFIRHLNTKTHYVSTLLKINDAATVINNSIFKAQIDQKYQHEFPTSFRHELNNLVSMERVSHRHQSASEIFQSHHLASTTLPFVSKVTNFSFKFVSKVTFLLIQKQQRLTSPLTRHYSDDLNFSKGDSKLPTSIPHETSMWNQFMSPTCDPQVFPCDTKVLQHTTKRSNGFASELDTEFFHLPKAALDFLSYTSTSCPDTKEPMIHDTESPVLNSLPVQSSWFPYQTRLPSHGCRTKLLLHINPLRLWPRNLLLAKCMCDGSRCEPNGPHKCITIRVAVVSLIRDKRQNGDKATRVRRQKEMLPVGCACSEQKSVLLREHQPHILE
jgi:hypothetical protein